MRTKAERFRAETAAALAEALAAPAPAPHRARCDSCGEWQDECAEIRARRVARRAAAGVLSPRLQRAEPIGERR